MRKKECMHVGDSALWQPDVKQFMNRASGAAIDNKYIYLHKCLRCRIKHDDILMPYIFAFASYLDRITILAFLSLFRLLPTKPATNGPLKVPRHSPFVIVLPFPSTLHKF